MFPPRHGGSSSFPELMSAPDESPSSLGNGDLTAAIGRAAASNHAEAHVIGRKDNLHGVVQFFRFCGNVFRSATLGRDGKVYASAWLGGRSARGRWHRKACGRIRRAHGRISRSCVRREALAAVLDARYEYEAGCQGDVQRARRPDVHFFSATARQEESGRSCCPPALPRRRAVHLLRRMWCSGNG